ncbi:MAG: transposase [Cyanobacteriota bacterium]
MACQITKDFYTFLSTEPDFSVSTKFFSEKTNIHLRTVQRWCKKGKIPTEYIRISGRKIYTIIIDKLDGKLRRRYLTNLYKQYGIDTKDLKTARLQYHNKLIWGTTDLSIPLKELAKRKGIKWASPAIDVNDIDNNRVDNNSNDLILEPEVNKEALKQAHNSCNVQCDDSLNQEHIKTSMNENVLISEISSLYQKQGQENIINNDFQAPVVSLGNEVSKFEGSAIIPTYLEEREEEKTISMTAKIKARAKEKLVFELRTFLKEKKSDKKRTKIKDTKEFVVLYNTGVINEALLSQIGKITERTLRTYNKRLGENDNYEVFLEKYKCSTFAVRNIKPEVAIMLNDLLLSSSQFDIATSYEWLVKHLKTKGIDEIPSKSSCRRYAEDFKKNRYDVYTFGREGGKALKDKVGDYTECDSSNLKVNELWVTDGNTLDFQVLDPVKNTPIRATLQPFFDQKSCAIVGFEITPTGNTDTVWSALRSSIINAGMKPTYVKMDNGKESKNKQITTTLDKLFIKRMYAKAYNARAKKIERFFEDLTSDFCKAMPTYIGNCIANRPAHHRRDEKDHQQIHKDKYNDYMPTIEEAKKMMQWWIDEMYHQRECPNVKGKTIGEVFEAGKGSGIEIKELDEVMMYQEERKASRTRVKLRGHSYSCNKLYGINKRVLVRYNPMDLSKVYLYDEYNVFIGVATLPEKHSPVVMFKGSESEIKSFKEKQRELNLQAKKTKQDFKKALKINNNETKQLKNSSIKLIPEYKQIDSDVIEIKTEEQKLEEYYKEAFSGNYNIKTEV